MTSDDDRALAVGDGRFGAAVVVESDVVGRSEHGGNPDATEENADAKSGGGWLFMAVVVVRASDSRKCGIRQSREAGQRR